jgi:hypothetical protein
VKARLNERDALEKYFCSILSYYIYVFFFNLMIFNLFLY